MCRSRTVLPLPRPEKSVLADGLAEAPVQEQEVMQFSISSTMDWRSKS